MKRSIIISLSLLSFLARGQQACIPVENVMWVNQVAQCIDNNCTAMQYYYSYYSTKEADTIINGALYKKLFLGPYQDEYFGALRADSVKAYFVQRDSVSEDIIFDFSLAPGDTIEIGFPHHTGGLGSGEFYVTAVDSSQMIYNIQRPTIHLKEVGMSAGSHFEWVYGIGSLSGLFVNEPTFNISQYSPTLDCMSIRDTSVFPDSGYYKCNYGASFSMEEAASELNLYPNPAQNYISLSQESGRFRWTDIHGSLLREAEYSGYALDVSEFENGTYILQVETPNGWTTEKVIIQR
ncbi:MAG: T9SS type A sorting domain-containing protein [Flavobacteriia bacterium]|nr:T9SS type A sorting domain-containing protein [Flavobacteriia bacterium]